jgi:hypothetical protein
VSPTEQKDGRLTVVVSEVFFVFVLDYSTAFWCRRAGIAALSFPTTNQKIKNNNYKLHRVCSPAKAGVVVVIALFIHSFVSVTTITPTTTILTFKQDHES